MMSGIKGKDTLPELKVRKLLHQMGFRYRLHDAGLPGGPDIVLARHRAIIEVRGCFWHRHQCRMFKWPATRQEFWKAKLQANVIRDESNRKAWRALNWKLLIVWECALKGKYKMSAQDLSRNLEAWLLYDPLDAEIASYHPEVEGQKE